jgi:hypothetical protein
MYNANRREDVVSGLRALADFLESTPGATLNDYGRLDIGYYILDPNREASRIELSNLTNVMEGYGSAEPISISKETRKLETTTQHIRALSFGNGTVAYQATWIEKTGDTEDV